MTGTEVIGAGVVGIGVCGAGVTGLGVDGADDGPDVFFFFPLVFGSANLDFCLGISSFPDDRSLSLLSPSMELLPFSLLSSFFPCFIVNSVFLLLDAASPPAFLS